ncbi:MAG: cytochrome c maturation protein CcmE [Dehalococcoidia bacterium]|nr:cytochrome c maturation protein CcmE [Dehalococcoidia bacterium]
MKSRTVRIRFVVGGILLVLAVGYLLYLSLDSSVSYYLTVDELVDKGSEVHDTRVRVAGQVLDGSVDWNAEELELRFTIVGSDATLPVVYDGAKPDGLKADANVLVDGRYLPGRIFRATQILMKCPSKYEPKE